MNDVELQHAVAEELEWAPHVDASHVTVSDGIVRLTGFVGSLAKKKAAECTVWHIRGVRGLVPEIEGEYPKRNARLTTRSPSRHERAALGHADPQ